jgi:hypothetical protein
MKLMQPQTVELANGITFEFTASIAGQSVVYNAVGYRSGDYLDPVATFGRDLSPEELIKAIVNTASSDYLESCCSEDDEAYLSDLAITKKWVAELEMVRNQKIAEAEAKV